MADAVEIVLREARRRVEQKAPEWIEALLPPLLEAALTGKAVDQVPDPVTREEPVPPKPDAKDRAWRTLAQGLVATVLVGLVTAVGTAVAAPGFNVFAGESWQAVGTAAGTAAVMSVLAYVQRLLQPPRAR